MHRITTAAALLMSCVIPICLRTAAALGDKVTDSSENLLPGLSAFPGKALVNSSQCVACYVSQEALITFFQCYIRH